MTKTIRSALLPAFMALLLAASCALALDPALTLRDKERGTAVNLYPTGDKEDEGLLFYFNERFGYAVKVPHEVFTEVVVLPDNEDGMILASKDGGARFRVSGGNVVDEGELKASFESSKKAILEAKHLLTFENLTDESWDLCWWEGKVFHQRRFLANEEVWCDCEISYPAPQDEGTEDPLEDILHRAIQSLGLAKE